MAGTFPPITLTDQTPHAPLENPWPSSFQPRYISGFGSDDKFTVFFEDRDASYNISYASTTTGPTGFPASVTPTNIVDTHFVVKDWPINIGGTDYDYRAWGSDAVGNNKWHHFYGSNDLTNWTLMSTFEIPNATDFADATGWVYYGFHDVIKLNDTYYAFAESNTSQTMIVRSVNGDDVWEAFASVGEHPGYGPLELPLGVSAGWTPSGSFVDLGYDHGFGKIHVDPRDNNFYLAVNTAAKACLSPAQLEAAFIKPDNWSWHDGNIGPPISPILSGTIEHDLRECWVVPKSDPDADWEIVYNADYGSEDGGKSLGYATFSLDAEVGAMSYFHVKKFELKPAKGEIKLEAEFILGDESDGLDLDNDDTTLLVTDTAPSDVLNVTIPWESWSCKLNIDGSLKECKAKIEEDGTTMEVKLKPDKKNPDKWKFSFKGKNMAIALEGDVVHATLTIGDDIGSETCVPVKVK